jgi:cytochrome c5
MRTWRLAFAAPLFAAVATCTTARHTQAPPTPAAPPPTAIVHAAPDFDRDVKPILEKQCRPCHFTGGVMYEKLPFDRAETIRHLGEKLFTRIKAPQDQATIRSFLGSAPGESQ